VNCRSQASDYKCKIETTTKREQRATRLIIACNGRAGGQDSRECSLKENYCFNGIPVVDTDVERDS
jgi:hypothetical protein